jgi:hypothetical protein
MIGLAIAGRIARDSRTYKSVIVITGDAAAGLGWTGGTQTFARLAARDGQRTANALRTL